MISAQNGKGKTQKNSEKLSEFFGLLKNLPVFQAIKSTRPPRPLTELVLILLMVRVMRSAPLARRELDVPCASDVIGRGVVRGGILGGT